MLTYSTHIQSLLQCHPKSHTQRALQHMQNIHTHHVIAFLLSHYLCQCETCIHPHTVPLTAEVVVEPRHKVEGCVLFRGAFAPCSSCHLVPETTPRFPPVFMSALRGHSRRPLGEATLALAPALAASPPVFGEVSLKSSPEHWTSRDDSVETVALRNRR